MNEKEPVIGIDLGTSFACIAIMKDDKVEIISDNFSEANKIPSIICFPNKNKELIGKLAINYMIQCPKSIIFECKRLIGYKFKDNQVKEYMKRWPMKIIEDTKAGKPKFQIKIENDIKEFFPEDIYNYIFQYLII